MRSQKIHEKYLQQALAEASKRRGFCAPNPAVGSVVVKDDRVVSVGSHFACGEPHAEAVALQRAGEQARGSTLYVTLEPCNHTGRTPPCVAGIIAAGIARVYFAKRDHNPNVAGGGQAQLQQAGILCEQIELAEVTAFYQSFDYWLATNKPWVTAKIAMSLNGKIAASNGEPIVITQQACQRFTHQQRLRSDAILTSVNAIKNDDPQLNVRLGNDVLKKPLYVIDTLATLPLTARVLQTTSQLTVLHTKEAAPAAIEKLQGAGVHCQQLPASRLGVDLLAAIEYIGTQGIHDLWIEAGGRLVQSFYQSHLLKQLIIYVAPKWLPSSGQDAFDEPINFTDAAKLDWSSAGDDAVLSLEFD